MGTKLVLYLMKAYRTNPENEDWMAHVRNMDSMINSNTIQDVQALQDNAKRYCTQLVNEGKWKKPKAVQQPFYINNDICLNNYNDNFTLEYNLTNILQTRQ